MADPTELESPIAKLKRARTQLYQLQISIQERRDRGAYTLDREFEREGPLVKWTWIAETRIPLRIEWSVVVGEILFDMRSALDHIAYALAARWQPIQPVRVTFPIYKNRGKFWAYDTTGRSRSAFRNGGGAWRLLHIPPVARPLVIELQPYQYGNKGTSHPLWLLDALCNEDKHRGLHLLASSVQGTRLQRPEVQNLNILDFEPFSEPFDGQGKVGWLLAQITGPKAEIDAEPGFSIEEAFSEPSAAARRLVGPTLLDIYNFIVDEVIDARFRPYFESGAF